MSSDNLSGHLPPLPQFGRRQPPVTSITCAECGAWPAPRYGGLSGQTRRRLCEDCYQRNLAEDQESP